MKENSKKQYFRAFFIILSTVTAMMAHGTEPAGVPVDADHGNKHLVPVINLLFSEDTSLLGTLVINPDPDDINAPWTLTGPNGYSQSLTGDQTLSRPSGSYTLTWGEVPGWTKPTPASETRFLTSGGKATFAGTYTRPSCPAIPNGDFESGRTVWTEYSSGGYDLINISGTFPSYLTPHSGSYAVWQGGAHNEISHIQQQVTVPTTCPILSFYHFITSEDIHCGPGYDIGFTRINGTDVVDTVNLCMSTVTNGWVVKSVDLSAYAGQTVLLQIGVTTDSYDHSHWFIDDVSFKMSD